MGRDGPRKCCIAQLTREEPVKSRLENPDGLTIIPKNAHSEDVDERVA
jgi:hypothetical protein